jgi:hypothetical protein
LRATTLTLGTALVLVGLGPVALSLLVSGNSHHWIPLQTAREWASMIEAALAPHQNLMTLIFPHGGLLPDAQGGRSDLLASLFGPIIYGTAAGLMWPLLRRRFRQMVGRIDDASSGTQPPLAEPIEPVAQPVASPVA